MLEHTKKEEETRKDTASGKVNEPEANEGQTSKSIVRLQKMVQFDETPSNQIDEKVIHPKFYNNFNYSLFATGKPQSKMTFGVTSPHPGDGKSLVASNLAVSLALSSESDIVLVDLNLRRPHLHDVFFTELSPGFIDAINAPTIRIVPTKIGNLSILTAGDLYANNLYAMRFKAQDSHHQAWAPPEPTMGLEQLIEFRNILFSLEEKFDIVIIDFPSIEESVVPTLFMEPLNGVIIVVNSGKTKKEDIDELLKKINANKVLGFVFNRVSV